MDWRNSADFLGWRRRSPAPFDGRDAHMAKLADLDFTDLYVRLDAPDVSRFAPSPRKGAARPRNMAVPEEFDLEINLLRAQLAKQEHDDFALDLENMRMRGSRCVLFGDQQWVALRRLPLDPPKLAELGFRPEILQQLRSYGQRSGLIIVGGATRAGKTTTLVGMLTEYLRTYGGVAYTIEDPVEYYLQGEYGEGGYCFQREVHQDPEWGEAVKASLRWAPRYIFLGEVRTPAAAKWLLRAATSGHLVMCTVHGGTIEETLSAILQIAQTELGDTASHILADGLCTVIHQSLVNGRPNVRILSVDENKVRSTIRSGKLEQLGTEIQAQAVRRSNDFEDEGSESGGGGQAGGQRARVAPARPSVAGQAVARPQGQRPPAAKVPAPPPPPAKKRFGLF